MSLSPNYKSITSVMRGENAYDSSLLKRETQLCMPTPDKWKNRAVINFSDAL